MTQKRHGAGSAAGTGGQWKSNEHEEADGDLEYGDASNFDPDSDTVDVDFDGVVIDMREVLDSVPADELQGDAEEIVRRHAVENGLVHATRSRDRSVRLPENMDDYLAYRRQTAAEW